MSRPSTSPSFQSQRPARSGDVVYRTVLRYPRLPDVDDEVTVEVSNAATATSVNRERKKSSAERRNPGAGAGADASARSRLLKT